MSYCPKCMSTYRDGFSVCADCGAALADGQPEEIEPSLETFHETDGDRAPPVLLCSVADGPEADMVISLLTENHIPALGTQRGSGQYLRLYMGMSFQSVDIYVPAEALPRAVEMVYPLLSKEDETSLESETPPSPTDEENAFDESVGQEERRRRVKAWLVILFVLLVAPGLLWTLIALLSRLLER